MRIPVPLKDGAYAADYETLRKTFWLHCRHTSVAYIGRMTEMLEAFTNGFAAYLAKDSDPGSFANFLRSCYRCLNDHQEGLARLRRADHSGFKLIRGAMNFRDPFTLRVNEYEFGPLGYNGYGQPCQALWCWIDKVIPMCGKTKAVLGGKIWYPWLDVSQYEFPAQIGGYPLLQDVFIKDGEDIPITGVWQPQNLKGGCPNFLIQGEKAPKANLPVLRYDTPEHYDRIAKIQYPARTEFDLKGFPTVWQLVWEDDRWRDGREPLGEYEYIAGPDTELPKDPPVALRDPPEIP
ncbi:MAG TPA: Imm72 family immunity protein [Fibrobacteria bacterium]|nr:Imm72 family immunity protein [Fibrobacteria bacterium]